MRKIWLLVIALSVVTAIVLAYTWQSIPYLNTWLVNSGVISMVQGTTSGITDAVNNLDPKSLVGIISGSVGSFLLIGKTLIGKLRESREQAQQLQVGFQEEKGTLLAGFNDAKEMLTGNVNKLQEEYNTLKMESESQVSELEGVISVKDDAMIDVQGELSRVQAELLAEKSKLLDVTKEMDEYRIALEQKSVPTSH